jgi:hypothetical protein
MALKYGQLVVVTSSSSDPPINKVPRSTFLRFEDGIQALCDKLHSICEPFTNLGSLRFIGNLLSVGFGMFKNTSLTILSHSMFEIESDGVAKFCTQFFEGDAGSLW